MKHRSILSLAAALLALAGCGDGTGPDKPVPGPLTLTLTTPSTGDRALVISISGTAEITAVESANPAYKVFARGSGTAWKAAVFGPIGSGAALRISVPDVRQASAYTATVAQAADAQNAVRASTTGYTVTVAR